MPDLRYVISSLTKAPWFTAAAVLTFGVGIGVNLAAFSVLDRVLFRDLPYQDPERLVLLRSCGVDGECYGSFPSILAFEGRRRLTTIADFAVAAMPGTYSASPEQTSDPPVRLTGVSPNLLQVLGVKPTLGRDFTTEDAQLKRRVAVISFEAWHGRFGSAPDVLGRELWGWATPVTIVGVLPQGFIPPTWTRPDPRWDGLVLETDGWAAIGPKGGMTAPIARLAPGATPAAAQAEMDGLVAALQASLRGPSERQLLIRVDSLQASLFSRFRPFFWLIVAATAMLLVLACANLSTLLLARGRSRERDVAIRSALGGSPGRLIADALCESVAVCMAGTVLAVGVLALTTNALLAVLPPLIGRYAAGIGDPRVLTLALGGALLSAVVAGIMPAWRVARVDALSVLQGSSGSGRRTRLRGGPTLIAIQAALGVGLLLSATLVLRSFQSLKADDLGFSPERLYSVSYGPGNPTGMQRAVRQDGPASFLSYLQLLDVLRNAPGIQSVAGADVPVGARSGALRAFSVAADKRGGSYEVSANYFDVLRTRFLAGRGFSDAEVVHHEHVAILNISGLRLTWPNVAPAEAIGRVLPLQGEPARTIVGVIPDLKGGYGAEGSPALYVPLGTKPVAYSTALIRMQPGAVPDFGQLRQRIQDRMGGTRLSITYLPREFDDVLQDPRFRAVLFTLLACVALVLSAAGLYAVTSLEVGLREYEMGVRLSLGANGSGLQRLVVRQACGPVVSGILFGIAAAYWASQFLQGFLYEVQARDPWMYVPVVLLLLLITVLAAWIPTRRASRLDPATVLRAH